MTARLWQMTRVGTGDYTLLSNDQTVLWRMFSYDETGTVTNPDGRAVVGKRWVLARFKYKPELIDDIDIDADSHWGPAWDVVAELLPTRQACIDTAMEHEPVGVS